MTAFGVCCAVIDPLHDFGLSLSLQSQRHHVKGTFRNISSQLRMTLLLAQCKSAMSCCRCAPIRLSTVCRVLSIQLCGAKRVLTKVHYVCAVMQVSKDRCIVSCKTSRSWHACMDEVLRQPYVKCNLGEQKTSTCTLAPDSSNCRCRHFCSRWQM